MTDEVFAELALLRDLGFTHLDLRGEGQGQRGEGRGERAEGRGERAEGQGLRAKGRGAEAESAVPSALGPQPSALGLRPSAPATDWQALVEAAHNCTQCRLAGTRTNVVFGVGNPNADLMFVGEAPGRDEDLQGEPFVGRAGQLLTDIIKAMKLTREQVYIANVIKCRPPENRNPEADELDACRPFIRRQVELIKPKVIVTLGRFGLQSLTEKSYGITAVRGQWLDYNGIKLMPTYHPAYLLRNPAAKKDVWADMKKVMAELGIGI